MNQLKPMDSCKTRREQENLWPFTIPETILMLVYVTYHKEGETTQETFEKALKDLSKVKKEINK